MRWGGGLAGLAVLGLAAISINALGAGSVNAAGPPAPPGRGPRSNQSAYPSSAALSTKRLGWLGPATIHAGAGPLAGQYSPSFLTVQLGC